MISRIHLSMKTQEMRLLDFIALIFVITISLSNTLGNDEPSLHVWCDEDVLNRILGEISSLNRKVELLSVENSSKKLQDINESISKSVKEYNMQKTMESTNEQVKEIRATQKDFEKHILGMNQRLHDLQNVQIERLQNDLNYMKENFVINPSHTGDDYVQEKTLFQVNEIVTNSSRDLLDGINTTNIASIIKLEEKLQNDVSVISKKMEENQQKIQAVLIADSRLIQEIIANMKAGFGNFSMNLLQTYNKINLIEKEIKDCSTQNRVDVLSLKNQVSSVAPTVITLTNQTLSNNAREINKSLLLLYTKISSFNGTIGSMTNPIASSFEDCSVHLKRNNGSSGVYNMNIGLMTFDAYCLSDPSGGNGWTIIQRRQNGLEDFNRNWDAYKHGFGNLYGDYWLGLAKIFTMTALQPHELWIKLIDQEGQVRQANYDLFEIGYEEQGYFLKRIGKFSGDTPDCLGTESESRKFTTFDRDNDDDSTRNCADRFKSPWWYNNCNWSSLNGEYNNTNNGKGVNWSKWHGFEYSLKYAHMAIRSKF